MTRVNRFSTQAAPFPPDFRSLSSFDETWRVLTRLGPLRHIRKLVVRANLMQVLGPSHATVLCAGLICLGLLFWVARSAPRKVQRRIAITLGIALLLAKVATFLRTWHLGHLSIQNALPMHLCDWATFVVATALLTQNRTACEIGYFWGLAGTLQAIFTPDLHFDFPATEFFLFFFSHGGIVLGAIFALWVSHHRLTWRSVWRSWAWLHVYAACALVANFLTGANYGYLMKKPGRASLLDFLGPWPWYILVLEVLAVIFFVALLWLWRSLAGRMPTGTALTE